MSLNCRREGAGGSDDIGGGGGLSGSPVADTHNDKQGKKKYIYTYICYSISGIIYIYIHIS